VGFSPDGALVVLGGADEKERIHAGNSYRKTSSLFLDARLLDMGGAFSVDGKTLALGGGNPNAGGLPPRWSCGRSIKIVRYALWSGLSPPRKILQIRGVLSMPWLFRPMAFIWW